MKTVVRRVSNRNSTLVRHVFGDIVEIMCLQYRKLDHAVNASRKLRRNIQIEARFQHRGVEKSVSRLGTRVSWERRNHKLLCCPGE